MTAKKKNTLLQIGSYAGAILVCISLVTAATGIIKDKAREFVDDRIDKKTAYQVILLRKMATVEQLKAADEEYKRFGK